MVALPLFVNLFRAAEKARRGTVCAICKVQRCVCWTLGLRSRVGIARAQWRER